VLQAVAFQLEGRAFPFEADGFVMQAAPFAFQTRGLAFEATALASQGKALASQGKALELQRGVRKPRSNPRSYKCAKIDRVPPYIGKLRSSPDAAAILRRRVPHFREDHRE
jgi:hypothetical protein